MKRFALIAAFIAIFAMTAFSQTPWKIVDMEMVNKHGGNCDYDDETCTATFTGQSDRWFDLPEVSGDLWEHSMLHMNILKSDVILRIHLRYKDEDGKIKQTDGIALYGQMGKAIDKQKLIKVDLKDKGKVKEEILRNVAAVRIAMAKACGGEEEPWDVQFGEVAIY